jgi:hypothetical protein
VACKESTACVEYGGQNGRTRVIEQVPRQQVGSGQRQKRVECDLPGERSRRNSDQEKWPMQRIPRRRLWIGQERHSGEFERCPVGQSSGAQRLLEIFLGRIMYVYHVPLDGGLLVKQRSPIKDQRSQSEGGPYDAIRRYP